MVTESYCVFLHSLPIRSVSYICSLVDPHGRNWKKYTFHLYRLNTTTLRHWCSPANDSNRYRLLRLVAIIAEQQMHGLFFHRCSKQPAFQLYSHTGRLSVRDADSIHIHTWRWPSIRWEYIYAHQLFSTHISQYRLHQSHRYFITISRCWFDYSTLSELILITISYLLNYATYIWYLAQSSPKLVIDRYSIYHRLIFTNCNIFELFVVNRSLTVASTRWPNGIYILITLIHQSVQLHWLAFVSAVRILSHWDSSCVHLRWTL